MRKTRIAWMLAGCCLALLSACSEPPESPPADDLSPRRGARTLEVPGGALPPDHPAIESGSAGMALHWEDPAGWETERPASSMRLAQYRVPGPEGDAQCVVYYFGPGQGGDPMANATRWAGQFTQPDGRSSLELMQVTALGATRYPTQIVEVTGTYDGGMTMTMEPATPQPNSMLLASIVEGPDAPWFFKLTGPEATVRRNRDAFVKMMESIHPGP